MSPLPRGASFALLTAAFALAWLLYGGLATAGHLGFDAFPLYAAGAEGPIAAFTDELMGGRYPDGRFHRPITSLVFWLDGLLGGATAPERARLTDVAVVAVGAWLAGLAAGRLARARGAANAPGALLGAVVAALVVALSPAQLDLAPFPARRAEGLCAIGLTWTLVAALSRSGPALVGAAALFAVWSKETGVLALPLAAAGAAWAAGPGESVRAASRAGGAALAAIAVAAAARLAVLGGFGGHGAIDGEGASGLAALRGVGGVAEVVLDSLSGPAGASALALAALACAAALGAAGRGRSALLAAGWLVAAIVVASLGGRAHAWYAGAAIAPLAILAGAAASGLRGGPRWSRLAGALAIVLAAICTAGVHAPDARADLEVASHAAEAQIARLTRALTAERTRRVPLQPYVPLIPRVDAEPIFVHAPYSLEAAAELLAPERVVRVVGPGGRLDDPRDRPPADLVVELVLADPARAPR